MWHLAAPQHDEIEFQDCRGWSMKHHHRKRLLKPKMGKAALRAEIQGQGKEVLHGRSAFKRSIRGCSWKNYSHKLNKAPVVAMRREPIVKARRELHNVARRLQQEKTSSMSSSDDWFNDDWFCDDFVTALEEHGIVLQEVQHDSSDSALEIDGNQHFEMRAESSAQKNIVLEELDAVSRLWRKRCRRRAWWLQDFKPVIGTRVKLVGCNLMNPYSPSATSNVIAKGSCAIRRNFRRPAKGPKTSSQIIVKGSLGIVHGMLPDGGVSITFPTISTYDWRIPQELLAAFRSLRTLEPGRRVRHHKFGSSVIVSHQDASVIFRVDGETATIKDHVGSVLPLNAMAKTPQFGDCFATSEKALLRSKEKSLLRSNGSRERIYLADDGRRILDSAADSRIIVEVCRIVDHGVVMVKPRDESFSFKHTVSHAGVWRPDVWAEEGWWPYEVPASALHPQQLLVLTPQCTAGENGTVRIAFTTMSGTEVAAGLEVTINDALPIWFWSRVFAQAKLPEVRIAVALPDGRIFKGGDIRRITGAKDILPCD